MNSDKRTLGRTALQITPLALGTVELGLDYGIQAPGHFGRPAERDAISLVHAALDAGVNLIDTARAYGASESVLGQALQDRRDAVILATKATTRLPDGTMPAGEALRSHLLAQLEMSLAQLQTDRIEIWQLHNVDSEELAQAETIAETFAEAKRRGQVEWVGGSFYGAATPLAALKYDLFDTLQVTYSVFDQRIADQLLPQAHAKNVGVIVRSVLLKGALTARADHLPDHLEALRAHSRRYRKVVADFGMARHAAQVAVAFALHHPQIHAVLVGVRTEQELHENLQAVEIELSQKLYKKLADLRLDDEALLNPGTWGIAG